MDVSEQLAFRCAWRGGACDCVGWSLSREVCALDHALATTPPLCDQCGQPTHLHDRFRLGHEPADGAGVTMQLVELLHKLKESGIESEGAELRVFVCDPCDIAEILFVHADDA